MVFHIYFCTNSQTGVLYEKISQRNIIYFHNHRSRYGFFLSSLHPASKRRNRLRHRRYSNHHIKTNPFKHLTGSIVYTVGLHYFENISLELNTEHFIAVAFGGAILGAALSLILRNGGCIDGSEILANILTRKISDKTGRNYSLSPILITFNAFVYLTVFILIDQNSALLSLLVYIVATTVTDHFTDHFEAIKQVTIITKHPTSLIRDIKTELNKTCTIIDSKGVIAGENTTLICYVNFFELQTMREIISKNKGSFSTVSTIDEILR